MKSGSSVLTVIGLVTAGPVALSHDLQCPFGFELVGKKCEKTMYSQPLTNCVVGELQGDRCVASAQQIRQCPIGTTKNGNQCIVKQVFGQRNECPSGYTMENGNCYRRTPMDIIEQCETGRPNGAGGCVVVERVSKTTKYVCPNGYFQEGDGCMRISEYDCSPQAPPLLIPKKVGKESHQHSVGHAPASYGHAHHHGHRMLGAKKSSYVPVRITPQAPVHTSKEVHVEAPPVLPSSVAVVKQMCRRQDFAPPLTETFCPSGYVDDGVQCSATKTYPMSRKCSNGAPAEACFGIETASPIQHCENGEYHNGECVKIQAVPEEVVCPAGTEDMGGACVHYTRPSVYCPAGLVLDGMQCIGKEISEPRGTIQAPCTGKGCFSHY